MGKSGSSWLVAAAARKKRRIKWAADANASQVQMLVQEKVKPSQGVPELGCLRITSTRDLGWMNERKNEVTMKESINKIVRCRFLVPGKG